MLQILARSHPFIPTHIIEILYYAREPEKEFYDRDQRFLAPPGCITMLNYLCQGSPRIDRNDLQQRPRRWHRWSTAGMVV